MSRLDYAGIKKLGEELGRPPVTLYALATSNDPFYVPPYRRNAAEWFAGEWYRLQIPVGWHYRRIHYVFVSQDETTRVLLLNGKPYENTIRCWQILCEAARDAAILEFVPQGAFVDHRNAEPAIYLVEPEAADIETLDVGLSYSAPDRPPLPRLRFYRPTVPQPYHVEIWVEKTTVDDVLVPLAEEYAFNLVTGVGELSATRCREFVDRAEGSRRPVRVLYISDFDPAGRSMPVAVARKIEHEIYRRGLSVDVHLRPIALTPEQCVEYRLPRSPIKETENRKTRFEERFGEGATELDALEALRPGLLREIVVDELARYWNPDHEDEVARTCENIEEQCREVTELTHQTHQAAIDELTLEWEEIAASIEAWTSRARSTWHAIRGAIEENSPYLDDIEWVPPFVADEDPDPLFDSARSYVEQIDRYKTQQGKPTEGGAGWKRTHPRRPGREE